MKEVSITDLNAAVKREDLILNAKFKLAPSKRIFSRIRANLGFDDQLIKSFYLGIPYYYASQEEHPLRTLLSLENVNAGTHIIKLELSGLWPTAGPSDTKEITFEYQPLVEMRITGAIPTLKKIEGPCVAVETDEARRLYEKMRQRWKRELIARRER
jgi:hypothetical protein